MKRRPPALFAAVAIGLTSLGVSAVARASTEPPDDSSSTTVPGDQASAPAAEPGINVMPSESTEAGSAVDTAPATSLPAWDPDAIDWSPLGDGVEEGWLEVPIDYANPDAGTFQLYLVRHPAANPAAGAGTLLVNPGGPGFSGTWLAQYADQVYDQPLLDAFDIVAWDPRGTGMSEPYIDCIDNYDEQYAVGDITPDDDAERQQIIDLAEGFADACASKNAAIIQFIGTNNSARDMDSIRRSLGADEISYFGFSYGSELGATWATLFPDTVRAAVLDGASDPDADMLESSLQQTAGFEGTLTTYLASCSADPTCTFNNGGDAEGAFDALMLKLDAKPIPSTDGRPDISRGVALQAVGEAMYSDALWPELSDALSAAQQGDGSGLLALFDSYYERQPDGTWDNSLEAFQSITCMDAVERTTIEEEDAEAPLFQEAAPRFAPGTTGSYFCTFFPESSDPRVEITGAGAGPIVVCGATGDPATPLASSVNMARALEDGRLIVIAADQHTCYGADPCADQLIDDYLVNLNAPPEVTLCPGVPDDAIEPETPSSTG